MSTFQIETLSASGTGVMDYESFEAARAAFEGAWTIDGSITLYVDGIAVDSAEFDEEGAPL